MRFARIILSDCLAMSRVFGPWLALRWLLLLAVHARDCLRRRDLRAADLALGEGPFHARLRSARALLAGHFVISNAREIWARDVYMCGGFLSIPAEAVVVDLGANRGVFTALALGHGPGVRVVSVEADPVFLPVIRRMIDLNGAGGRVQVVNAMVGGQRSFQRALAQRLGDGAAPERSEADLVASCGLRSIDLLKCDIEGSEYGIFVPGGLLLSMSRQVAVELHRKDGDPDAVRALLEGMGFEVRVSRSAPEALILLARRGGAA
jgi:FkbM family methyltransferase